jgi:hypothetical protein
LFILFLFLTQLFQGEEFHCPCHRHLACVHHLLYTISECLMAQAYMFNPHHSTMSERSYTHLLPKLGLCHQVCADPHNLFYLSLSHNFFLQV